MDEKQVIETMHKKPTDWLDVTHTVCWNMLPEHLRCNFTDLRHVELFPVNSTPLDTQDFFAGKTWVVVSHAGEKYLVNTQGYTYARYIVKVCCTHYIR